LLSRKGKHPIEDNIDDFIGNRVATQFGNSIFFGSVVEKIRGAVLGKEIGTSTGVLQVVWRIVYDDENVEQMNLKETIAAIYTYRLRSKNDYIGGNTQRDLHVLAGHIDDKPREEFKFTGLFGSATIFFDPRCRLMDIPTPDAKQNRLSYLVELLWDKYRKGI
jgi:hypothetical protein